METGSVAKLHTRIAGRQTGTARARIKEFNPGVIRQTEKTREVDVTRVKMKTRIQGVKGETETYIMKLKWKMMKKIKGLIVAALLFTGAGAQVPGSQEEGDKTARFSFKTVYETNAYYNEVEENIELKYANLKVPIFEKMEAPQDSLWMIEEQVAALRELIKMEEFNFIQWEKNADRNAADFEKERASRQAMATAEINKMRAGIEALENRKPAYVRDLKSQEVILKEIDREKEKELEQAKQERQAALAKMYRA